MVTAITVKEKIQGLIDKSNNTTGNSDTTLTDAVNALVEGYGSGGEEVILTELVVTENGVYDEPVIEGEQSITWDGVVGDKPCVYADEVKTSAYVKVSDAVLSFDDFVGAVMTEYGGTQFVITEDFLVNVPDVGVNCAALILSIRDADVFDAGMGLTFSEEGTYFNISFASGTHIESLTFSASTPADGWNKVTVNVAGDIIDVPELPTENIEEGKIYRVSEVSQPKVELMCALSPATVSATPGFKPVMSIEEMFSVMGRETPMEYHVVEALPEDGIPSADSMHVYVVDDPTSEAYVYMTQFGGWFAFSGVFGGSYLGTVNKVSDITEIGDEDRAAYYILKEQTVSITYGIPNAHPVKRLVDGAWVDLT